MQFNKIFPLVFICVGVLSICAALIVAGVMLSFRSGALRADGVVEFSDGAGFYVRYTANNGREYTVPPGYESSAMRAGNKFVLWYDPENPNKTQADGLIWFSLIPGGIGVIFGAAGLSFALFIVAANGKAARLIDGGKCIYARIVDVRIDLMMTVNNRHPFIIICEYDDEYTGKHMFKSKRLWFDPGYQIDKEGIEQLPVYTDGDNFDKYYVDVRGFGEL